MSLRSSFLAVAVGSILMLAFAVMHLRSSCRPRPLIPAQLTDLDSLLNLVNDWERQADDPQSSLSRVSAQLASAIAVAREPAPTPCPTSSLSSTPSTSSTSSTSPSSDEEAFRVLATAGTQCHVMPHTDLWADPVVWGGTHHTASAAECCAACAAHQAAAARGGLSKGINSTTCNVWVYCGDAAGCRDMYGECWLKNLPSLPPPESSQRSSKSPWTSGVVYPGDSWLEPYERRTKLTLHFEIGDVEVTLLPDLAPASVRELRRLAGRLEMEAGRIGGGGGCDGCRLYRVETNFLVQGVIRHPGGYVSTPRHPNPPQRKVMERGLVCWAGGAGGPDFFVNLIDQSGFGDDHLCWGKVDDMALLDAIVQRPIKPKAKPNDMTFLARELSFNMTLS